MTNSQIRALETLKARMAKRENDELIVRRLDPSGKRALVVFGPDLSRPLKNVLDYCKLTADPRAFHIGRRGKVTEVAL